MPNANYSREVIVVSTRSTIIVKSWGNNSKMVEATFDGNHFASASYTAPHGWHRAGISSPEALVVEDFEAIAALLSKFAAVVASL